MKQPPINRRLLRQRPARNDMNISRFFLSRWLIPLNGIWIYFSKFKKD